jgi:fatty acid desaturase
MANATELKPLYQHNWVPNLKIPVFYAIWIGLGVIAWNSENTLLTWLCYVGMGYMMMGIVTFMHDCTHSVLFKARWKNWAFGLFAMIPFIATFSSFRHDHLTHHRYNRSPKDPDAVFYGKRGVADFLLFYGFCFLGGVLSLFQFCFIYAAQFMRGKAALVHWSELAMHALVYYFVLGWASDAGILSQVLSVWMYPMIFFSYFNSMRFIGEHYGTPYDMGQLAGTRTVLSNPVHRPPRLPGRALVQPPEAPSGHAARDREGQRQGRQ